MAVISVEHLHKRYGRTVAVEDVSLSVERGEIFGIVGPNGAGKTTTVEVITGLRRPDGGTVTVLGLDPFRDRVELRRRVGVQLQDSTLPDKLTVAEALDLYASFYPAPLDADALLADLGLAEARSRPYAALSGGQKQRLSVALALIGDPEIAVLDELSTGLDPQARRETWALIERIRDRGVTVLLVTHAMEEVQRLCDRVAIIDRGRVVALDTPAALVGRVTAAQRIRFRPTAPFDDTLLRGLAEVASLQRDGDDVVVTGDGQLLYAVTAVLARHRIGATHLRMDAATLEDAFLALTGRSADDPDPTAPLATGAA